MKGNVVLKAGTKVFGKVTSSRANSRKSGPLAVELASIDLNGRRTTVKTNDVQPGGPPQTARQAHYGHTAGTTVVNPQTLLQFQLLQPVSCDACFIRGSKKLRVTFQLIILLRRDALRIASNGSASCRDDATQEFFDDPNGDVAVTHRTEARKADLS